MNFCLLQLSATVYTPEYRYLRSRCLLRLFDVTIALYFYGFSDYNCFKKDIVEPMILSGGCHSELDPFKLMLMKLYFKGTVLVVIALMVMTTTDMLSN